MFIWLLIELAAGGEEEVHGRVGGWRYVLVVENGTVTAHALECTVRRIIGISPVRPDPGNWVSPYPKAKCVQGWCGTSKLRKQDVSILGPDDADIGAIGRLNPGLSLELLSNQQFLSREILQKDNGDKPGLVKNILDDTSQTNDDTILNGLNKTVLKVGRCGRTSREFGPLLHSATG